MTATLSATESLLRGFLGGKRTRNDTLHALVEKEGWDEAMAERLLTVVQARAAHPDMHILSPMQLLIASFDDDLSPDILAACAEAYRTAQHGTTNRTTVVLPDNIQVQQKG